MFKIENLIINNFKNIIDTEVAISDFNVVVGPNNSGKSNFLQVIPFLRWLINGDIKAVESYLKSGMLPGVVAIIKNEIREGNLKIVLEYVNTKTSNIFSYELQMKSLGDNHTWPLSIAKEVFSYKNKNATGKPIRIFDRKEAKVDFGKEFSQTKIIEQVPMHASVLRYLNLIAETQAGPKAYKEAFEGLDEILSAPVFFFSTSELRKNFGESPQKTLRYRSIYTDINSNINLLYDSSEWEIFAKLVSEILGIDKIIVDQNGENIPATILLSKRNRDMNILIDELSDGSLLILSFITEVLTSKHPLILIEEPENSLHPKALTELIGFMQSKVPSKQFILTTHSPALLNLVYPEDVIIARLQENGNSTLEKIKNMKELKRKLSKGYVNFGDLLIDNIDEVVGGEEKEY